MARQYVIGADEIVGDDLLGEEELAGAAPVRRLAALPGQASAQLRTRAPSKGREYPLGFDSGAAIAAGATAIVSTQPQVVFRVDRVVIPASVSPFFLINDLKVGKNSQLASAVSVPAEVFSQGAFGVRLKGDTAQISQVVSFNVTNIDAAAHRFLAAIVGPAVE